MPGYHTHPLPAADTIQLMKVGDLTNTPYSSIESFDSTTVNPRLVIKRSVPTANEEHVFYLKGEIPEANLVSYIKFKLTICG